MPSRHLFQRGIDAGFTKGLQGPTSLHRILSRSPTDKCILSLLYKCFPLSAVSQSFSYFVPQNYGAGDGAERTYLQCTRGPGFDLQHCSNRIRATALGEGGKREGGRKGGRLLPPTNPFLGHLMAPVTPKHPVIACSLA